MADRLFFSDAKYPMRLGGRAPKAHGIEFENFQIFESALLPFP